MQETNEIDEEGENTREETVDDGARGERESRVKTGGEDQGGGKKSQERSHMPINIQRRKSNVKRHDDEKFNPGMNNFDSPAMGFLLVEFVCGFLLSYPLVTLCLCSKVQHSPFLTIFFFLGFVIIRLYVSRQ